MCVKRDYVTLRNGCIGEKITLTNELGHYVELLTLGGIIKSIYVPDKEGILENMVLEFNSVDDYIENEGYINALIGRTGGRIHKGQVTLDDAVYQLTRNQGENTLHGGKEGIHKKIWDVVDVNELANAVTLQCLCEDGEEGYPGRVTIQVTYCFDEASRLTITYDAVSDKKTIVNLTNHAYFNLSGNAKHKIEDHILKIEANKFCELDAWSIPTGVLLSVEEESAFNFLEPKPIGKEIDSINKHLENTRGYDHPFVLDKGSECVTLCDPISKRWMSMSTDQKAVVVYTMNYENSTLFTNGLENIRRYGVCFEAQALPIGHNEVFKEEVVLEPNERYRQVTSYLFGCDE